MIVWLTGLPCAGKTTLADQLAKNFKVAGYRVEILDADEIRKNLWSELRFSKQDRVSNTLRLGYLARILVRNGVFAIVAAISPYREARDAVRRENEGFVEVYVRCPIEVCIARDVKGLYRRAFNQEIKGVTGVDDPYETPVSPEVTLDTDIEVPDTCVDRIMSVMKERGYLG